MNYQTVTNKVIILLQQTTRPEYKKMMYIVLEEVKPFAVLTLSRVGRLCMVYRFKPQVLTIYIFRLNEKSLRNRSEKSAIKKPSEKQYFRRRLNPVEMISVDFIYVESTLIELYFVESTLRRIYLRRVYPNRTLLHKVYPPQSLPLYNFAS